MEVVVVSASGVLTSNWEGANGHQGIRSFFSVAPTIAELSRVGQSRIRITNNKHHHPAATVVAMEKCNHLETGTSTRT